MKPEASVVHGLKAEPKDIPSVDRLLARVPALVEAHGHRFVADEARALLDGLRVRALATELERSELEPATLAAALEARCVQRLTPRIRRVLNLTGTVIHTNLGRSLLADAALAELPALMSAPNNLEYDLASGGRGDRDSLVEGLLCELTGAEAATVVNNNAAAVLLSIAALAGGREVIVSRGELVEIGGAFRMPDVMAAAGARLVEVGTTNRTHPRDYENAIGPQTAMLMKVHTSNYRVQGFTSAVDEATLAEIAHRHGLPLVSDLGSGSLVDLAQWGLPREPLPQEMLKAGCDVVTFSGDKLLGGPQAGLIVGKKAVIERIRKFPMKRALRMSKLPLAALEATLRLYLQPERLTKDLPTLRLLTRPLAEIERQAQRLQPAVQQALQPRYAVSVRAMQGQIGSGSLPVESLPSAGLVIAPLAAKGRGRALEALAKVLRELPVPVIGRIADDMLWLDLRCLERDEDLAAQLASLSRWTIAASNDEAPLE
ncbi:L-seryl-tRNA(Sec) selenium transferase [Paucibacter sp. R3-3]|uniref:L-seryl-tRNA(Sec) selenium transferase n=1 Tax=Roseateles agri TaxID=3098619 RepID=A0ABU5DPH8_9BURK|nr:L-seryl-tRNA(Sec) selenium transferase [Paucibacter sp. R3-3]MDY0748219.1 L-seryl-tRNA(Sec) selenium transferase [Paucibacter sp. R3-3]